MFSNLFPDLNSVIILLPHLTFTNIILKNMSKNGIIIYIFQEVFSLSKIAGTIITIEDYLSPYFKMIECNYQGLSRTERGQSYEILRSAENSERHDRIHKK